MSEREPETPAEVLKMRQEQASDAIDRAAKRATAAVTGKAKQTGEAAQRATERSRQAALEAARRNASSINADEFVDRRKKSRNRELVERAEKAARLSSPYQTSLQPVGDPRVATAMASANAAMGENLLAPSTSEKERPDDGIDPDWEDNPENLDSPEEVRENLRSNGLDPMDVDTKERAMFANALLHAWANDPDRGGRTPEQLEAEHDMVAAALLEYDVDHDSELDLEDIEGASEDDPFGLTVDFSPGGGL